MNIAKSLDQFMHTFLKALAIKMVVSLVSPGWHVGIAAAAAVPLKLAVVLVVMWATGRALDRITLGALILALGLLVDDAIITIETMVVKLEEGDDRIRASAWPGAIPHRRCWPARWSLSSASCRSASRNRTQAICRRHLLGSRFRGDLHALGAVKLLPDMRLVEGGHAAIYRTPRYEKVRGVIACAVRRKLLVTLTTLAAFLIAGAKDVRTVDVVARSAGTDRLDPAITC